MRMKMIAIWAAVLVSQLFLAGVVYVTRRELFSFDLSASAWGNSGSQIVAFLVLGAGLVVLSFAFRRRFVERAAASGNEILLTQGLIIALILCETCVFLGFALAFAFDYQYFYVWLILGIGGTLLHFPRGPHTIAAAE